MAEIPVKETDAEELDVEEANKLLATIRRNLGHYPQHRLDSFDPEARETINALRKDKAAVTKLYVVTTPSPRCWADRD